VRLLIIQRGRFAEPVARTSCIVGVWVLATVAFLVLAYAAASRRLERFLVTPAIFFTTTGLIAGPGLGLIDLHISGEPVKVLAEATLTLVLFSDAARISLRASSSRGRSRQRRRRQAKDRTLCLRFPKRFPPLSCGYGVPARFQAARSRALSGFHPVGTIAGGACGRRFVA
jgi:hypothetical protein